MKMERPKRVKRGVMRKPDKKISPDRPVKTKMQVQGVIGEIQEIKSTEKFQFLHKEDFRTRIRKSILARNLQSSENDIISSTPHHLKQASDQFFNKEFSILLSPISLRRESKENELIHKKNKKNTTLRDDLQQNGDDNSNNCNFIENKQDQDGTSLPKPSKDQRINGRKIDDKSNNIKELNADTSINSHEHSRVKNGNKSPKKILKSPAKVSSVQQTTVKESRIPRPTASQEKVKDSEVNNNLHAEKNQSPYPDHATKYQTPKRRTYRTHSSNQKSEAAENVIGECSDASDIPLKSRDEKVRQAATNLNPVDNHNHDQNDYENYIFSISSDHNSSNFKEYDNSEVMKPKKNVKEQNPHSNKANMPGLSPRDRSIPDKSRASGVQCNPANKSEGVGEVFTGRGRNKQRKAEILQKIADDDDERTLTNDDLGSTEERNAEKDIDINPLINLIAEKSNRKKVRDEEVQTSISEQDKKKDESAKDENINPLIAEISNRKKIRDKEVQTSIPEQDKKDESGKDEDINPLIAEISNRKKIRDKEVQTSIPEQDKKDESGKDEDINPLIAEISNRKKVRDEEVQTSISEQNKKNDESAKDENINPLSHLLGEISKRKSLKGQENSVTMGRAGSKVKGTKRKLLQCSDSDSEASSGSGSVYLEAAFNIVQEVDEPQGQIFESLDEQNTLDAINFSKMDNVHAFLSDKSPTNKPWRFEHENAELERPAVLQRPRDYLCHNEDPCTSTEHNMMVSRLSSSSNVSKKLHSNTALSKSKNRQYGKSKRSKLGFRDHSPPRTVTSLPPEEDYIEKLSLENVRIFDTQARQKRNKTENKQVEKGYRVQEDAVYPPPDTITTLTRKSCWNENLSLDNVNSFAVPHHDTKTKRQRDKKVYTEQDEAVRLARSTDISLPPEISGIKNLSVPSVNENYQPMEEPGVDSSLPPELSLVSENTQEKGNRRITRSLKRNADATFASKASGKLGKVTKNVLKSKKISVDQQLKKRTGSLGSKDSSVDTDIEVSPKSKTTSSKQQSIPIASNMAPETCNNSSMPQLNEQPLENDDALVVESDNPSSSQNKKKSTRKLTINESQQLRPSAISTRNIIANDGTSNRPQRQRRPARYLSDIIVDEELLVEWNKECTRVLFKGKKKGYAKSIKKKRGPRKNGGSKISNSTSVENDSVQPGPSVSSKTHKLPDNDNSQPSQINMETKNMPPPKGTSRINSTRRKGTKQNSNLDSGFETLNHTDDINNKNSGSSPKKMLKRNGQTIEQSASNDTNPNIEQLPEEIFIPEAGYVDQLEHIFTKRTTKASGTSRKEKKGRKKQNVPKEPETSTLQRENDCFGDIEQSLPQPEQNTIGSSSFRTSCQCVHDDYLKYTKDGEVYTLRFANPVPSDDEYRTYENLQLTQTVKYSDNFSAGYMRLQPNDIKKASHTTKNSLTYHIVEGSARVQCNNRISTLQAGAFFVIPVGSEYTIHNADPEAHLVMSYTKVHCV